MTTQSEQYDKKLQSDLHIHMLQLQEKFGDMIAAHEEDDTEALSEAMMLVFDVLAPTLVAYFKAVEGGKSV